MQLDTVHGMTGAFTGEYKGDSGLQCHTKECTFTDRGLQYWGYKSSTVFKEVRKENWLVISIFATFIPKTKSALYKKYETFQKLKLKYLDLFSI